MTKFYTDEQQIIDWLDEYKIKKYTLVPDEQYGFVIDVSSNVYLSYKKLTIIPIKFNKITGSFYCNNNKLISLEFSPQIVSGSFYCSHNQLTLIEFSPQTVGGSFSCSHNKIASLEFCPETVGSSFYCGHNPKLKEIQKITDFKLIYLEHEKVLDNNLSNKLDNNLSNDNSKKTAKIKI